MSHLGNVFSLHYMCIFKYCRSKLKDKLDSVINLSQPPNRSRWSLKPGVFEVMYTCLGSGKYGRFLQGGEFETSQRKFVGRFFL